MGSFTDAMGAISKFAATPIDESELNRFLVFFGDLKALGLDGRKLLTSSESRDESTSRWTRYQQLLTKHALEEGRAQKLMVAVTAGYEVVKRAEKAALFAKQLERLEKMKKFVTPEQLEKLKAGFGAVQGVLAEVPDSTKRLVTKYRSQIGELLGDRAAARGKSIDDAKK